MLDPDAVYTICTDRKFEMMLEKPDISEKSGVDVFPLSSRGGSAAINCTLKGHSVQSKIENTGNGGQGVCGAVNNVRVLVLIDGRPAITEGFANYCNGGGLSGFRINSYSDHSLDEVILCGYWSETEQVGGEKIKSPVYKCTNYEARNLTEKGFVIEGGRLHPKT